MPIGQSSLSEFTDAYIEAALLHDTEGDDKLHALSREILAQMRADCRQFYIANEHLITEDNHPNAVIQAGYDFWLTRQNHGAGFWGGDWMEPAASQLTAQAEAYPECNLYIGDDNLIYATKA